MQFDAEWDVDYRPIVRRKLQDAEQLIGEQVNFGEVDCDQSWDLARSINVPNVPLVAYFRQGKLIAALVGCHENVQLRLERLLHGEVIGYRDRADTDDRINFWPYSH